MNTTIALTTHGRVLCWGSNVYDECTNSARFPYALDPEALDLLGCVADLDLDSVGYAISADGTITAWGSQLDLALPRELLDTASVDGLVSLPLPSPSRSVLVGMGNGLANLVNGETFVWGRMVPGGDLELPRRWEWTTEPGSLELNFNVFCELAAGEVDLCRGLNACGEAGVGFLGPVAEFTPMAAKTRFVDIVHEPSMACGIDVVGDVYCWGSNWAGQLGIRRLPDAEDPIEEQCISTPTKVEGVSDVVALDVDSGACAVEADGDVWCWGFNYSRRIRSFGNAVNFPVHLPDVSPAKQVALGRAHACFLRTDDSVWCRGSSLSRGRGGEWAPEDGTATPVDLELLP